MANISDVWYYMAAFGIVVFGGMLLINWLMNGFFFKFLKVKASRGRKIMVNVHTKIGNPIPTIGWIEGKVLRFHTPESRANDKKNPLRIPINDKNVFYRQYGIIFCNYDEATPCLMLPSLEGVKTWDPIKWNELYQRALNKPSPEPNKNIILIIILLGVLLCLVLSGVALYQITKVQGSINALQSVAQVAGVNV